MEKAAEADLRATVRDHLARCGKDGDVSYHEDKIVEKVEVIIERQGRNEKRME